MEIFLAGSIKILFFPSLIGYMLRELSVFLKINLRYILYIPLERLISFVTSCSTGLFLKLTGSSL
jgi:hypothetical protein